jgi:hypothetical protein
MNDIAQDQRAYAEAGPWDRLGNMLRIGVAVLFVAITVIFFATAQNGLVSASDIIDPVVTPPATGVIAGS